MAISKESAAKVISSEISDHPIYDCLEDAAVALSKLSVCVCALCG